MEAMRMQYFSRDAFDLRTILRGARASALAGVAVAGLVVAGVSPAFADSTATIGGSGSTAQTTTSGTTGRRRGNSNQQRKRRKCKLELVYDWQHDRRLFELDFLSFGHRHLARSAIRRPRHRPPRPAT